MPATEKVVNMSFHLPGAGVVPDVVVATDVLACGCASMM
jgi:hypothetical protein